jgi:hypothetical protein
MEIILNLAWVLLAAVIVRLCLLRAPSQGTSRRMQIAALAMLILLLFPVISVTDDLQNAQNIAESDTYLRRVHAATNPHSIFPAVAMLPPGNLAELSFRFQRLAAPFHLPTPTVENPALAAIESRPPPAA